MLRKSLSEREELILQAVVHSYITFAEPIGSRAIVKQFNLDISPATVRNVMADLEEAGYLNQLHTSSGRVPTDQGYRYYVDYLMRVQEMTFEERTRIERDFNERLNDADAILRQTSHLLALMSHHTGIVEAPDESQAEVRHIEAMPIGGHRVVVLVADNFGRVRTMIVQLEEDLPADRIVELNRLLNENLHAVALEQLRETIQRKLNSFVDERRSLANLALRVLDALPPERPGQLFLDGANQLFEQPEFHDIARAQEVFGLLEERDRVMELLRAGVAAKSPRPSRVVIGSEAPGKSMEEISVVSAPYQIGNKTVGMVGVLGPRRMPYSRLTGVVEYTAGMLGRLLTRLATR